MGSIGCHGEMGGTWSTPPKAMVASDAPFGLFCIPDKAGPLGGLVHMDGRSRKATHLVFRISWRFMMYMIHHSSAGFLCIDRQFCDFGPASGIV